MQPWRIHDRRCRLQWMLILAAGSYFGPFLIAGQGNVLQAADGETVIVEAKPLRAALRELLAAGTAESAFDYPAFKRRYEAARALGPAEPYVDLCSGMTLLQQRKVGEGMRALDAARQAGKPLVPQAHRLFILYSLSLRKYVDAADGLVDFAQAVEAAPDDRMSPDQKCESAMWIGRILGFYCHPGGSNPSAEVIRKKQSEFAGIFAADRQTAYSMGMESIQKEQAKLQGVIETETEALTETATRERDMALERVFAGKDQAIIEKGKVDLTGAKLEEWHSSMLTTVSKELSSRLEKYRRTVLQRQYWYDLLRRQAIGQSVGMSKERISDNVGAAERQMAVLEEEVKGWLMAGQQIEVMYFQAKGQVARKGVEIRQFEQQLGKIKENIRKDDRPQERAARTKVSRLNDLSTYVPLDLAKERATLMDRLSE